MVNALRSKLAAHAFRSAAIFGLVVLGVNLITSAPATENYPSKVIRFVVPLIAGGPPAMVEATRATLGRSGVSRRHIVTERFAY